MQIRLYVTRLRAQLGGCAPRLLDAAPVAEDIDDLNALMISMMDDIYTLSMVDDGGWMMEGG